jgi:hypothetical protein
MFDLLAIALLLLTYCIPMRVAANPYRSEFDGSVKIDTLRNAPSRAAAGGSVPSEPVEDTPRAEVNG